MDQNSKSIQDSSGPLIRIEYDVPEDNQAIHDIELFNNKNNFVHLNKLEFDSKIIFQQQKQEYSVPEPRAYFTFMFEYIQQIITAVNIVHDAGLIIQYLSPSEIYFDCSNKRIHKLKTGQELVEDLELTIKLIDKDEMLKHLVLGYYGVKRKNNKEVQNREINYQAPEVIQGQPITNSADIWSLGCLFYYFISKGNHLIDNPNQEFTHQMIMNKLHKVKSLAPYTRYQAKIYQIIIKCLQTAPQNRITLQKLAEKINKLQNQEQKLHLKIFNYKHNESLIITLQDQFLKNLAIPLKDKQYIRSDLAKFLFLPSLHDYVLNLGVNQVLQDEIFYLIMLKQLNLRYKFRQYLLNPDNAVYASENVRDKVRESLIQLICYETFYVKGNEKLQNTFRHLLITKEQTINQELFARLEMATKELNNRLTSQYKFLIKCLQNIDQVFNYQHLPQKFKEYFTIFPVSLEDEKLYSQLIKFLCNPQIRKPATPEIFDGLLKS